jgi:hypothetical protein
LFETKIISSPRQIG